ncbi:MAG: LUD domain-containing protein [Bacteroidaceae bacterium]|nr:LUD domain-containing protein [Bacteroidaceae bacterium]
MSSREEILGRLRKNTHMTFDKPQLDIQGIQYNDPVAQFIHIATTAGGAKLMEIKPEDDINAKILEAYPDAKVISSNIPGVRADRNPDEVAEAQDLDGTDVGVIQGEIGVAENACIWIPQTMKEKAICFISENLVILLSRRDIVNNMHEAYKRIRFNDYGFGTFISGPSKTADIEQSLVYGAQAARGVTIFLTE